jgi:hypothetical protein
VFVMCSLRIARAEPGATHLDIARSTTGRYACAIEAKIRVASGDRSPCLGGDLRGGGEAEEEDCGEGAELHVGVAG